MFRNSALAIIALILAYGLYVFPFMALWALYTDRSIFHPLSLLPALFVFGCLWVYLRTGNTNKILRAFVYYGMGVGFVALWVVGLALLVRAVAGFDARAIALVAFVVILCLTVFSLINARTITQRHLTVTSAKITRTVRFAFISDVHIGSHAPSHLDKICDRLCAMDIDAVLIGGDLFDSSDFRLQDLDALKRVTQDIFFVTGNHEFYVKGHQQLLDQFASLKITVVDNQASDFAGINIIGIADNQPVSEKAVAIARLHHPDRFNLAMVHQPSAWERTKQHVDLMLCGHTHNGQIFPFRFLVKLQFSQIYGRYGNAGEQLYVSSGVGCWGPGMRLGSRNEIVLLSCEPD